MQSRRKMLRKRLTRTIDKTNAISYQVKRFGGEVRQTHLLGHGDGQPESSCHFGHRLHINFYFRLFVFLTFFFLFTVFIILPMYLNDLNKCK